MRWCAGIWRRWDVRQRRARLLIFILHLSFAFDVRDYVTVWWVIWDFLLCEALLLAKFCSTILKFLKLFSRNFKNFLKLTWNHTCKCTIRPYGKRKKGWEEPPISQKSNFDLFYSWEILRPFRHILHGRKMSQSRSVRERKLWNLIKIGTGTREVPEAQRCIFSNWISSCNHVGFLLLLKFIPWLASAMHSRDRSINLWVFNAFASALFYLPNWIWWLLICELYEAAQHWQVDIADFL